jgi:hypothetical protein
MLVDELITDAFYLSLYDEQFQPAIPGGMKSTALRQFNLMLDEFRDKIPYTFEYNFTDVDELEDTAFVSIDDVAYVINRVIFPLSCVNLVRWRETAIVEGLTGIPQIYWFDESTQSVRVYPRPANPDYQFIINGRRALGPLNLGDTLPPNMPDYLINTLEYELAFRLAAKFGASWSDAKEITRKNLMKQLLDKRVIDLTPSRNQLFPTESPSIPPFPYYYYLSGGGR